MQTATANELRVIDETGDSKTTWDVNNPDEVEAARETFNKLKEKKYIAYSVKRNGKKGEIINEFDPDAGMIIMSPPVVGG